MARDVCAERADAFPRLHAFFRAIEQAHALENPPAPAPCQGQAVVGWSPLLVIKALRRGCGEVVFQSMASMLTSCP